MNWWGSGFITQIIYAAISGAGDDQFNILTESNLDLLTENGDDLQIEH